MQCLVSPTHERGEVTVHLTQRAPDLPLDRAAELLRNTVFHHFTDHHYCQQIAALTVSDDAGRHALAQDRC
jgi:hypothetical protein